ncbi:hypothetical protein K505DRAFT_332974 [Melanomma pulvis-pyrius CBS 109.77]|uniref:Uncharacterized protein n=1 Tax=Melanomma pulvis-pyrius CBS 109.77 TaxID=1314802 RepID=A0A6A6XTY3_9PLEO|nr:hypothetical protein K505DRAFT_332974 [Melanomma pulvis-pyrius CBS 109.77]
MHASADGDVRLAGRAGGEAHAANTAMSARMQALRRRRRLSPYRLMLAMLAPARGTQGTQHTQHTSCPGETRPWSPRQRLSTITTEPWAASSPSRCEPSGPGMDAAVARRHSEAHPDTRGVRLPHTGTLCHPSQNPQSSISITQYPRRGIEPAVKEQLQNPLARLRCLRRRLSSSTSSSGERRLNRHPATLPSVRARSKRPPWRHGTALAPDVA